MVIILFTALHTYKCLSVDYTLLGLSTIYFLSQTFCHVLKCPFEHMLELYLDTCFMELILVIVHFSLYFLFPRGSLFSQMKDNDFKGIM
jgi:hypothetical protein